MTRTRTLTTTYAVLCAAVAATLVAAPAVHGDVLFEDDFENYSVDMDLPETNWSNVEPASETDDARVFTRDGNSEGENFSPFGSPNQYLEISRGVPDNGKTTARVDKMGISGAGTVGSLRFDLHHATDNPFRDDTNDAQEDEKFSVQLGTDSGGLDNRIVTTEFSNGSATNREDGVSADDRPSASYDMDTSFRATIVVNNNASGDSALNYGSGGDDLESGNLDLWLDDDLAINNSDLEDLSQLGAALTDIRMTIFGSRDDTPAFVDNVEYHDEAIVGEAIPEPATMALVALGGVGLLLKRRRRA